jgi:2',3'-cyclic-nucleotide 2'-phosphodiesterase (5'-nucleotidase family)
MSLKRILIMSTLLLLPLLTAIAQEEPRSLTIFHTNDIHTHFTPSPATWMDGDPPPQIGGVVALRAYLDQEKATARNSLVLDAGDWMTGTPLSDIEMGGAKGGGFINLMNLINYDATVIGNHELDGGIDNLERLIQLMKCDVLSANLYRDEQLVGTDAYKIYRKGGLKIAVIGLTLDDLFDVAPRSEGLEVHNCVETAQRLIDQVDPKSDLIVLLTHQGWRADSLMATQLQNADIIVGGHSHSRLNPPRQVNDMLIVHAGSYARYLGRLDLTVQDDAVTAYNGKLIPLLTEGITANPEISRLVQVFEMQIDAEFGAEIGTSEVRLARSYYEESDLGNLLTDILLASADVDFALLNSGGIRANLEAGPVSRLTIAEMLPFQNYLVRFVCTGKELYNFINQNARASSFEEHGIMQIAGIEYEWQVEGDSVLISEILVNGMPLDTEKKYYGITVDYALSKADRYFGFEPGEQKDTHTLIYDAVVQYIQEHPVVQRPARGRMKQTQP